MTDLPSPPLWLQGGTYSSEDDRGLLRAIIASEGIVASGDLAVSANGTPNMSVNVATGRAFVQRTSATDFYMVEVDATTNLTIAASDATNARKDIVVARVYDAAYSGASNKATLEVVTGTPSATPAEPAVPANALKLAVVDVAAGATTISSGNITDSRALFDPAFDALPKGVLGYAQNTAGQSGITSETDISGLSVTVDVAAGRKIRVSVCCEVASGTSAQTLSVVIAEGATTLQTLRHSFPAAGYVSTLSGGVVVTPGAGSHTYKVRMSSNNLAGTFDASAAQPAYILVEDIGPA